MLRPTEFHSSLATASSRFSDTTGAPLERAMRSVPGVALLPDDLCLGQLRLEVTDIAFELVIGGLERLAPLLVEVGIVDHGLHSGHGLEYFTIGRLDVCDGRLEVVRLFLV